MILVIGPLVQGAGNRRANIFSLVAYVCSMVASATIFGAALGYLGWRLLAGMSWGAWALALVCASLAVREVGLLPVRLPSSNWQVPRGWIGLGEIRYPAMFGAAVGLGFITKAPFG